MTPRCPRTLPLFELEPVTITRPKPANIAPHYSPPRLRTRRRPLRIQRGIEAVGVPDEAVVLDQVGLAIGEARKARGMSRKTLAELSGVGVGTIGVYEAGHGTDRRIVTELLRALQRYDERVCVAAQAMREEAGLSIRGFAAMVGIDPMTVLRVEAGKQSPDPRTVRLLARALERLEQSDAEELELQRLGIERGSREHLRDVVPWWRDEHAQAVVEAFPGGLPAWRIGEFLDLSETAVLETIASGCSKLAALAEQDGPEGDLCREWVELIRERAEERDKARSVWDDVQED